jgi:hypothetical protein
LDEVAVQRFPYRANGNRDRAGGKRVARSRTIMGITGEESALAANPAQTTAFFGVKRGFPHTLC